MWFKMHPWVFPIIIGSIGILYLIINIGAIIETKKIQAKGSDHHVSGIPFLGGIHILIAGLISPIKWLALLCVLDFSIFSFLYAFFFAGCFNKDDEQSEKASKAFASKNRMKLRTVKAPGVKISDILAFLALLIFSVAGFVSGNVILGYLAGVPAVLLFPYLTFKRPFFKADVRGILYRKPTGFQYGNAIFIEWKQVQAIIVGDKVLKADEEHAGISEYELNADTLSGLDAFTGFTQEEYENQAEWTDNGFFIVIKQTDKEKSELLEVGSLFHQKDFLKKLEMLKALWLHHC